MLLLGESLHDCDVARCENELVDMDVLAGMSYLLMTSAMKLRRNGMLRKLCSVGGLLMH